MVLVLDLGNTNLYVGVYQNGKFLKGYRTDSDLNRSTDMYEFMLSNFLFNHGFNVNEFEGAILSSVIPTLTFVIQEAVTRLIKKECLIVGNGLKTGLNIQIDNPNELGCDLVSDSVGATKKYGYPVIICDLGTANKLMLVDKNGSFVGTIIAPGMKTSQKALSQDAAQLFDISFKAPKKVIGKNTPDSLNSGAVYGNVAWIEGMTQMIEKEAGYPCKHVLTGGNAAILYSFVHDFIYDPTLILDGLYEIYLKNKKS